VSTNDGVGCPALVGERAVTNASTVNPAARTKATPTPSLAWRW